MRGLANRSGCRASKISKEMCRFDAKPLQSLDVKIGLMAESVRSILVTAHDLDSVGVVVKEPQDRQLRMSGVDKVQKRTSCQVRVSLGLLRSAYVSMVLKDTYSDEYTRTIQRGPPKLRGTK